MKIQITDKSENKMSWINTRVGEVHSVIDERSADAHDNITGHDEYIVRVESGSGDSFLGCVAKHEAKVVEVGTERLTVGDLWPNDLVLIRGEVATVGMTNGAKVEITYQGGRTETVNPKNIKIVGVA